MKNAALFLSEHVVTLPSGLRPGPVPHPDARWLANTLRSYSAPAALVADTVSWLERVTPTATLTLEECDQARGYLIRMDRWTGLSLPLPTRDPADLYNVVWRLLAPLEAMIDRSRKRAVARRESEGP